MASEPQSGVGRPVYGIEDRPPGAERLALGAQHVFAMLLGNITPPLLIAGALGLAGGDLAQLLQAALLMAGVATIVQAYPIGPIGGRLPIVMGTSVAFVGAAALIGRQHGLAVVFGSCLVAALVEVVCGVSIVRLRPLFPPIVNAVVVMLIGLTLIPVGIDYAAGGVKAADYGAPAHLLTAAVVFVVTLGLNQFARGFLSHASLLLGALAGYAVALAQGLVDLGSVASADWFAVPRPLAFGLEFHWPAILLMSAVYVVSTMETIGDISGIVAATGREPTDRELSGGLVADGVMSGLAALMSAFPNTSYSQNVGRVHFTGVASRHVTAVSGGLLLLLGTSPKIGALFATLPAAVIGGGGLIMFSMIFSSGVAIFDRSVPNTRRHLVILAVSIGLGLGIELRPAILEGAPQIVGELLGSGLVTGGFAALLLHLVLPLESAGPIATDGRDDR